jgi:hypothetical protein
MRHCRLTVGALTPRTSAVSSTERPPKKRSSTIFDFCGSIAASRLSASSKATRFTSRSPPVRARVVNEDAAHHLRGDAEEVRAVLPLHLRLVYQTHVSLVDERGRLERVPDALLAQVARGEAPQLAVDDGQQVVQNPAVAVGQTDEQPGHILL